MRVALRRWAGGEMMKFYVRTAAALAVASTVLAFTGQSHATVFAAWQVANVPFGDTLNARKYPSGESQKQAAYPNGTVLQMTGRCTGGINLLDIAGQPHYSAARPLDAQRTLQHFEFAHDLFRKSASIFGVMRGLSRRAGSSPCRAWGRACRSSRWWSARSTCCGSP